MAEAAFLGHRVDFVVEYCCQCQIPFAMSKSFFERVKNKQRPGGVYDPDFGFYCPAGHQQWYTGKTEAQILQDQLDQKDRELRWAREGRDAAIKREDRMRRSRDATRGHFTRIKTRVIHGVCPCCNRSFQNLRRHMKSKHPKYKDEKAAEA